MELGQRTKRVLRDSDGQNIDGRFPMVERGFKGETILLVVRSLGLVVVVIIL